MAQVGTVSVSSPLQAVALGVGDLPCPGLAQAQVLPRLAQPDWPRPAHPQLPPSLWPAQSLRAPPRQPRPLQRAWARLQVILSDALHGLLELQELLGPWRESCLENPKSRPPPLLTAWTTGSPAVGVTVHGLD